MRKIGLHLRLIRTLNEVAAHAALLNLPIFQCFFIQQGTQQFVAIPDEEIAQFKREWRDKFDELYAHGSYWINLASAGNKILQRELDLAKKLDFTAVIIHPGSARKSGKKSDGITAVARKLNTILKQESDVKIILENTAHAGHSIGGDLHDFLLLRERLDHPEKVKFCIDSAHAYSYGYDIAQEKGQQDFFKLVEKCMGFENIALIHLNDTKQKCGSRIDRHEIIGEGVLSLLLPAFISYEPIKKVPIIMELPVLEEEREKEVLEMVRNWNGSNK